MRVNIQIFGTKKSFDTKKAQRWFKERRIKFQFIDLREKEMSKGELRGVAQAVGGIDALVNPDAKDEEAWLSYSTWQKASALTSCLKTSSSCVSLSCATESRPP